jgi:hypothetical protein
LGNFEIQQHIHYTWQRKGSQQMNYIQLVISGQEKPDKRACPAFDAKDQPTFL